LIVCLLEIEFFLKQEILLQRRNSGRENILNVGAGGYMPHKAAINVDPFRVNEGDVQAFGEFLPFKDNCADAVLCTGVLEHVPDPHQLIKEMHRVLKVGGIVYVEIPFLQPFHAAPHDYQRVTLYGLKEMFKEFKEIETGIAGGPGSAVSWILIEYVTMIVRPRILARLARYITQVFTSILPRLDPWLIKSENAHYLASGLYFKGQKTI